MLLKSSHIFSWIVTMVTAACIYSCAPIELDITDHPHTSTPKYSAVRSQSLDYRNVFIIYSMGFNNLTGYLKEDIEDIANSDIPLNPRDIVLVFIHRSNKSNYSEATSPMLIQLSTDSEGMTSRDTVRIWDKGVIGADAATMHEVLSYIKDNYVAGHYGILLSSHGTGWAPKGYCINPDSYEGWSTGDWVARGRKRAHKWFYGGNDSEPLVKGMGIHQTSSDTATEMDIDEIAGAFPMKMDYLIFDACLMGGVEVAYEFKDVTDIFIASQTEILADGMDYRTMTTYLLDRGTPDLKGFCENYFNYYQSNKGLYQSATISMTDCRRLDDLAAVCKGIFERNREGIAALEGSADVQKYYRYDVHKWFYDLEDIVIRSGASKEDIARLQDALEAAVRYKAHTEKFMSDIEIKTHCGLSMYLPYSNHTYLNSFYKTLDWNQATGLIK